MQDVYKYLKCTEIQWLGLIVLHDLKKSKHYITIVILYLYRVVIARMLTIRKQYNYCDYKFYQIFIITSMQALSNELLYIYKHFIYTYATISTVDVKLGRKQAFLFLFYILFIKFL